MKKSTKKRLVLLDAHAIIHRAYHALPDFVSSKGEPTGALYGLSSMLIRIIQDLKPDYIAACVDLPEKTHRHEVYEAYKGTRQKTDEALVTQLERAKSVFEGFGIPVISAPGFEADDCLGTIVELLKKQKDIEIVIASGDMDTLQLVRGKEVQVFTLRKGLNDTVTYDEAKVQERFGFSPTLIPDYKGLRGDPSDNIKGVKGIGEKAATELIQKIGSVNQLYAQLKKDKEVLTKKGIKPRVVTLLEDGEDDALFSVMLATIRTDAPISFALPQKVWRESVDIQKTLELFDALEFRSLAARFKALFGEVAVKEEEVGPLTEETKEAMVALWLLSSDMTNPTKEDVLRFTKKENIEEAFVELIERMRATGNIYKIFEEIEKPLIPIALKMQEDGILLDTTYLKKLSREYHEELNSIQKRIFKHAGKEFNVSSPAQLSTILFDELKLLPPRHKKTSTGKLSTKESELEKLKDMHPIIADILAYRELSKLLSTYVDALPELVHKDKRLHAEFLQTGTTTGRMSSQNPNLQNIPIRTEYGRRIRNAFVATEGYSLVALDYSQIELRIAAGLSGDQALVKIFKEGGDVHQGVASRVFNVPPEMVDKEMRRRAKIINFGILYGMGVNALRQNLGENISREEAAHFLADYFSEFSGLASYLERTKQTAARLGYTETLFGRRRLFSGFQSPLPQVRAQAERMALNAPIQGTQADIIKKAMKEADVLIQKEGWAKDVRLLLQVHDELVYEVKKGKEKEIGAKLKEVMEGVVAPGALHDVPIRAEMATGENWGSLKRTV